MANVAYVRVSSVDQNEARQREGLSCFNIDRWFIEKASGKNMAREELKKMFDYIREGDTVYILDFSRLSRSVKDLMSIIDEFKKKQVHLVSKKENLDTSTPTGKLMLTVIAAINEFERENLLERQREGIAIAKRNGKYKGRNKVQQPSNWSEVYVILKRREITGREAMKLLGLKTNTFYKFIQKYKGETDSNND